MKLSLKWLQDYIQLDIPPEEIARLLTSAGLEVESLQKLSNNFEGVVVGEILKVEKHPDADQLSIAQVSDGKESYQVVCAAPNCKVGLKTAFAPIGATLTDPSGAKFKIKKTKLRGVESSGMLCAADELGLTDEVQPGIMELDTNAQVGENLSHIFADTILEIGLTPNLGHCNCVIGIARELSASTNSPVVPPGITFQEEQSLHTPGLVKIEIQDFKKCPRYGCRIIKDVKVAPSPEWLQQRLTASGIRPINNIVDITNYVFLEMGQPLHAFDYDKISGQKIVVRTAKEGETFVTLDDKTRSLSTEDLLICDKDKAIAIAGVMGGKNSEVDLKTQNVLLEAAYFSPQSIRKTSKRLGLQTDSSKRFERGADPNAVLWALDRAAMLIQQLAEGKVAQTPLDIKTQAFPENVILCRLSRINQLLNTSFSVSEVENIFKRLDFTYSWDGQDKFTVKVPTYRVDILSEVDLIEEVARIYGYDNIKFCPPTFKSSNMPHAPLFLFERTIRERLISEGLQEFLTCDLIGPSILDVIGQTSDSLEPIKVMNPISIEQSILRTSLLPGLLQLVKYNIARQNREIAGFEIGRIHFKQGDQFKEQSVVGIILSGEAQAHTWYSKPRPFDFYDLKGILENVLQELRIFDVSFKLDELQTFHSGRQTALYVNSLKIGSMGEVHPSIIRRLDVPQRIYFAELNLHDLLQVRHPDYQMENIPIYPGSERDWTITLKEEINLLHILHLIKNVPSNYRKGIRLLDIFRGEKLSPGMKNVTLRFIYRDDEKTISQESVDKEHNRLVQETMTKLNLL